MLSSYEYSEREAVREDCNIERHCATVISRVVNTHRFIMQGADTSDVKDFSEDFVVVEQPEGAFDFEPGRSGTNNGVI